MGCVGKVEMFNRQSALPGHEGRGPRLILHFPLHFQDFHHFFHLGPGRLQTLKELDELLQGVNRLRHEIVNSQDGPRRGRVS